MGAAKKETGCEIVELHDFVTGIHIDKALGDLVYGFQLFVGCTDR